MQALLGGSKLSLTELGRHRAGSAYERHHIKAADKLLANRHLHAERDGIYRAICRSLLCGIKRPVVLVDWSDMEPRRRWLVIEAAATDAGFRGPWFKAVEAQGWDWVGRIRNKRSSCLRPPRPQGVNERRPNHHPTSEAKAYTVTVTSDGLLGGYGSGAWPSGSDLDLDQLAVNCVSSHLPGIDLRVAPGVVVEKLFGDPMRFQVDTIQTTCL